MSLSNQNKLSFFPSYISSFTLIVIFALLVLVGVALIPKLTIRFYPSQSGSNIFVTFRYPRATAEAVEMEVTSRLEGVFSLIEGISNIKSVSGDGWGQVTVTLARGTSTEMARFKIITAIREVYPRLPIGVSYPSVSSQSSEKEKLVQLLTYSISAQLPSPELKKLAEKHILQKISRIDGVGQVAIYGASSAEWFIEYDNNALNRHNISVEDIAEALKVYTYQSGVGAVTSSGIFRTPVMLTGPKLTGNGWNNIEVANRNGTIIRLGQIATVKLRESEPGSYFRINGQNAININIKSTSSANQIATANKIYKVLEEAGKQLPQGVILRKSLDNTTYLRQDLRRNLLRTLFSVTILLGFVLVTLRNFNYLLVVAISLAANLAIAIIFYYALNLEIHLYSLSGITLSLGLIIDNTLVMVDHLRHRKNLYVFTAIMAATLTTMGALVSVFFLSEAQRVNLTDFALVIIVNLGVSLLIALFLIPALTEKIGIRAAKHLHYTNLRLRLAISKGYVRFAKQIHRHKIIVLCMGILIVGTPIFLLPDKLDGDGFWKTIYNSTLGSAVYQQNIRPITDVVFGGTLRLFYNSIWEKNFWEIPERTRVFVRASLPQGSTLEQSDNLASIFESHITQYPEVEQAVADIWGKGFMIEITFRPEHENSYFPLFLKSKLEGLAVTQAGADINIWGVGLGFSSATDIAWANSKILITGYSHKQLMKWARVAADSLAKQPRVDKIWIKGGNAYWFTNEYRRYMSIDQHKLLIQGITPGDFADEITKLSPHSDWIDYQLVDHNISVIRIRPSRKAVISGFELKNSPLKIDSRQVRPESISEFSDELVGEEIHKENQEYIVTLAYNYIGPEKLGEKVLEKQLNQLNQWLPVGFKAFTPQSTFLLYGKENTKRQYAIIAVMVLIVFIVTAILLESLRQPVAVILLIPLSFVGVFLTYWIFDLAFDIGTYAAFLLLGGLVVNSAIYIINEQNNLTKRYPKANQWSIYARAVNAKIIPVILTVISTVLGLLPFVVFGKEPFWFSLATGTIGGLLFSIPALLLFLPALPGGITRKNR